jgi:hypothetical protein
MKPLAPLTTSRAVDAGELLPAFTDRGGEGGKHDVDVESGMPAVGALTQTAGPCLPDRAAAKVPAATARSGNGTGQSRSHGLTPGGRLVFESRDPAQKAWQRWNRAETHKHVEIPGVGDVTTWVDVTGISGDLVLFRWIFAFDADATVLTSDPLCASAAATRSSPH